MNAITRRTILQGAAGVATAGFLWHASGEAARAGERGDDGTPSTGALDCIVFGDAVSEASHALSAASSVALAGAISQPARVLEALEPASWWGGSVTYDMAVDAERANYFTIKLWGGDFIDLETEWRLHLFIDGEAVGWFDQGPVDGLDQFSNAPRLAEQFYLHTVPLPEQITHGKSRVQLEIRSMGRIWAYGGTASSFYRPMTSDSRPIYRGYTHVTPYFIPAADDPFGTPPATRIRANDDGTAIEKVRARVIADQNALLFAQAPKSIDAWAWMSLALGYRWEDGPAYQNPLTLSKICQAIDANYLAWRQDPKVLSDSPQQWAGFGRVGLALTTLWEELQHELDGTVVPGSTDVPNPGFEAGLNGWSTSTWLGSGTVQAVTDVKRNGGASARIIANASGTTGSVVGLTLGSQSRPLIGQGMHRISAWCRTENVVGAGAHLIVLYYGAGGTVVKSDQKFFSPAGTHDWQQISAELLTPPNATNIRIDVRLDGTGTAWFDDIALERLEGAQPPMVEGMPPRREAYRDMLVASREYWRQNQRHYTNQVQFTAVGIYLCNKALAVLSPEHAWPERTAREWIYEAVGLSPLSGAETEAGEKTWPLGRDYSVYTPKGLSRELGYVGNYGEVAEMLTYMYEAVTTGPGAVEDALLEEQIIKLLTVRGYFRHEGFDAAGNRAMRLQQTIGWRNEHFPGDTAYTTKTHWDGNPLTVAAVLKHPALVGWTQEQVADGQLGPELELLHTNTWQRVGLNAATFIMRHLPEFEQLPATGVRLPTGWGRPDFVFTDEVNGVVALKRGDEVFYVSLYWRAKQGVNDWARVHLLRPDHERSGTVNQRTEFGSAQPVGEFEVQDWVCWDFGINDSNAGSVLFPGGFTPEGPALHQGFAGKTLKIAQTPGDMDPTLGGSGLGIEAVEVGRAPFYAFEYAGYHIAMNTTKDQTFSYQCPAPGLGLDLQTGRSAVLRRPRLVGPRETVVLFDPKARR